MFGANNKFLSISINDGVIKVAQGSGGNVEKLSRATVASNAPVEEVTGALKPLLTSFNRSLPVICLVPASAATAKTIEVPSSDPEEIKSIINLQASRHTPYSRDEVLISYINLGLNATNNTRILLVIVQRTLVKDRISALEGAGLNVDRVLFIPEAQAMFYAKAINLKRDGVVGLIDFSVNTTSYMIISRGTLLFVRHIPIGIKTLVESSDTVAKLQDEIKKSMEAFNQEDGTQAPVNYIVTTKHEAVAQVLETLKVGLGIDFQVNAFSNVVKGSGDVRKKLQSDFADDSFLDVVAPLAFASRAEVNLMPEEMLAKKSLDRQYKELSVSGMALVIIIILAIGIIWSNIYFKNTFLTKNLQERYAPQKDQVAALEMKLNKAKLVRNYMKTRMASLDIIHDLTSVTPNTIYLNNITVADDGTITIDGVADSGGTVSFYKKSLQSSARFKEVNLISTSPKKDNDKDIQIFEIGLKLNDTPVPQSQESV